MLFREFVLKKSMFSGYTSFEGILNSIPGLSLNIDDWVSLFIVFPLANSYTKMSFVAFS